MATTRSTAAAAAKPTRAEAATVPPPPAAHIHVPSSSSAPAAPSPLAPGFGIDDVARCLRSCCPPVAPPASPKGHAAVLVPLFGGGPLGEARVVLTRRSALLTSHSGEVCLPGGKRDPEDKTDIETALREANEELGLDPACVEVLCQLPPLLSKHYLSVTPVIARIPEGCKFVPNPDEVDAVFDMPLSSFLGLGPTGGPLKGHSHRDVQWSGLHYRLHFFRHDEYDVWGLTAAILIEVARIAFGQDPSFEVHVPGHPPYTQIRYDGTKILYANADGGHALQQPPPPQQLPPPQQPPALQQQEEQLSGDADQQ